MQEEDQTWIEHRERFSAMYDESNYSSPLQKFAMHASHKLVEKAFNKDVSFAKVLEIGAGTGEHLQFVRHRFDQYFVTDMDPKAIAIAQGKMQGAAAERIRFAQQKGEQLEFPNDSFDRLIASHVLEHIYQPHLAIKEWRRVIKDGGVLSILIPSDPGLAWRLGRRMGPRSKAIAQGIAYDYLMAREHVNSCHNLIALLRHYFPLAKEAWWPLPLPSVDLNLFVAFHAVIKK